MLSFLLEVLNDFTSQGITPRRNSLSPALFLFRRPRKKKKRRIKKSIRKPSESPGNRTEQMCINVLLTRFIRENSQHFKNIYTFATGAQFHCQYNCKKEKKQQQKTEQIGIFELMGTPG